jgi:SAM-dependent methyltransferase
LATYKTTAPPSALDIKQKVYHNDGNPGLLRLIPTEAQNVLDVGCGAGDNARILRGRGCRVWGVTVSWAEAALAKRFCEEVRVVDAESGDLGVPDDFFDVLLFSHVLEHLVRPQLTLKKLCRYLSPHGLVVIAVPNMAHWRMRVRFLCGDWRFEQGGPMDSTHLHFWSYCTAGEIITAPLSLRARVAADPAVPLWPLRRLAPSLCHRIDRTLGHLWANLFATQTLLTADKIVARKSNGSQNSETGNHSDTGQNGSVPVVKQ